jgi:hypothetical protein
MTGVDENWCVTNFGAYDNGDSYRQTSTGFCCDASGTSACGESCYSSKCASEGLTFISTVSSYECCGIAPAPPVVASLVGAEGGVASLAAPAPANTPAEQADQTCRPAYGRGVGTIPPSCDSDHADRDWALCYPNCQSGYTGVGPVCWQNCGSGYVDDGAFCRKPLVTVAKQTYGRGVGTIPFDCGSKQYDFGLCYPHCRSGFNGVGPMCWGSGWDFFKSYGRGVGGIPTSCTGGNSEYQAGLCYTPCRSGFYPVGPVCWEECQGRDVGALCETQSLDIYAKDTYGRGVGVISSVCDSGLENDAGLCYPPCRSGYDGVGPVCWSRAFGTSLGQIFGPITRIGPKYLACFKSIGMLADMIGNPSKYSDATKAKAAVEGFNMQNLVDCLFPISFDDSSNGETTLAFEIAANAALVGANSVYYAVVFHFPVNTVPAVDIYSYDGQCSFWKTDFSIGVDVAFIAYRTIADIPGTGTFWGVGVDVPGTEIGVGLAYAFNADCEIVGSMFSAGGGIGVASFEMEFGTCQTNPLTLISSARRRRLLLPHAVAVAVDQVEVAQHVINLEVDLSRRQLQALDVGTCFEAVYADYYPQCVEIINMKSISLFELQDKCLYTKYCVAVLYDNWAFGGTLLSITGCSGNGVRYFTSTQLSSTTFYINKCVDAMTNSDPTSDDYNFLDPDSYDWDFKVIEEYNTISQYYMVKCPFNFTVNVSLDTTMMTDDVWRNIYAVIPVDDPSIMYPALYYNGYQQTFKLQIGSDVCFSWVDVQAGVFQEIVVSVSCSDATTMYRNGRIECNVYANFDQLNAVDGSLAAILVASVDAIVPFSSFYYPVTSRGSISCGETKSGTRASGEMVYYKWEADQDYQSAYAEGCGSTHDIWLWLYDVNGNEIYNADDQFMYGASQGTCGSYYAGDITITDIGNAPNPVSIPIYGTYFIGVGAYGGGSGDYSLDFVCTPASSAVTPEAVGPTISAYGIVENIIASKPNYLWDTNSLLSDTLYATSPGVEYYMKDDLLVAPYLKLSPPYLITFELKIDLLDWSPRVYNIFEIGRQNDEITTVNDMFLNYDPDQKFGLILGISTKYMHTHMCYGTDNVPADYYNRIDIYVEELSATVFLNDMLGCTIDLQSSPAYLSQPYVPMTFASTVFNPLKGYFRNLNIQTENAIFETLSERNIVPAWISGYYATNMGYIKCGETKTGSRASGEMPYYKFIADMNYQTAYGEGCGSTHDIWLYVFDANGNAIYNADDQMLFGSQTTCAHSYAGDITMTDVANAPNAISIARNDKFFIGVGAYGGGYGDYSIEMVCQGGWSAVAVPRPRLVEPALVKHVDKPDWVEHPWDKPDVDEEQKKPESEPKPKPKPKPESEPELFEHDIFTAFEGHYIGFICAFAFLFVAGWLAAKYYVSKQRNGNGHGNGDGAANDVKFDPVPTSEAVNK